jgi:hypothetical protein
MDRPQPRSREAERPGCAQILRHDPSRVARECVRSWREGRMTPHAGYVGQSAGFADIHLRKLHALVDPVAGQSSWPTGAMTLRWRARCGAGR